MGCRESESEAWSQAFLKRLHDEIDIETLALTSLRARKPMITSGDRLQNTAAKRLINSYQKAELAHARFYYNNLHLLCYWESYNRLQDGFVSTGQLNHGFPLYFLRMAEDGAKPEVLFSDFGVYTGQSHVDFSMPPLVKIPENCRPDDEKRYRQLSSLLLKLEYLHDAVSASANSVYWWFLSEAFEHRDVAWNYYQIHYFLDQFLYVAKDGSAAMSPFQAIFSNSNMRELQVFIFYHVNNNLRLNLKDVEEFLSRQRRYYVRKAIVASHNDITLLNSFKQLLEYDPDEGVVRINQTGDAYNQAMELCAQNKYDRSMQDGCPFAKSKGISRNALDEVYSLYDSLALQVLSQCDEFEQIF